ncbi:hypothetical protein CCACVL1_07309 [Corchorus capsularis]|uniref:Uncharacterized protein n=1 Tax=Corchorus capsularis TaxID=210143 RepID=A0A1R3J7A1_COCAP|nr:hypothetical protein CCACVL1_07309 [Corchorus capsularis]
MAEPEPIGWPRCYTPSSPLKTSPLSAVTIPSLLKTNMAFEFSFILH